MDIRTQLAAEIPFLRRFARALARDATLADDLVQDCLERAIARSHTYDPSRPLRAWLFAVLRNQFISGLRKNQRLAPVKTLEDLVAGEGATPPDQETGLSMALIANAMDALPDLHREVLVLVSIEEMSYRAAAEIIGVPIGTVMSRLSRARVQMQEQLEQRGQTVLRRIK